MGRPLQRPRRISNPEARTEGYSNRLEKAVADLAALGVSRAEDLSSDQLKDAISSGKIRSFDVLEIEELKFASQTILRVVPPENQTGIEIDKGDI